MLGTIIFLFIATVIMGACGFSGMVIGTIVGLFQALFFVFFILLMIYVAIGLTERYT